MSQSESAIAFIGLGVMGYPMAVNLRSKIGKDRTFVICDVDNEVCQKFKMEMSQDGPVEIVKNGYEAVQAADTVITVLPTAQVMKTVYLDEETGILSGVKAQNQQRQRKLILECGTMPYTTVLEISEAFKALQQATVDFVDAPISGGPQASKAGTLTFMVGSSAALFPTIKDLLVHMGKEESIFHCGDVGAGTASKTINNYISLITVVGVSEAYNIASRLNLDLKVLTDIFNASSAQCWVTSKNNPVPGIQPDVAASRNYEGGFRIELAQKDLSLGRDLAAAVGARTVLDKVALQVYDEVAADPRYAGKDARVVYKFLSET